MENTTTNNTSRLDAMITLFGLNNIQARAYAMYSKKPELLSPEEIVSVAKDLSGDLLQQKKALTIGAIIGGAIAYGAMTTL